MIYGIGNDLIEIDRIKSSIESKRFMTFTYSPSEINLFDGNAAKLAGNFAAKEALSKALGTGVRGFSLDEITVLRNELGKPFFCFEGNIKRIIENASVNVYLSITNTEKYAFATVVLDKKEN